jgi:hypothetical protein
MEVSLLPVVQSRRGYVCLKNGENQTPEIKKCDLVCANCHWLRTYERGQHDSQSNIVRDPDYH